MSQSPLERIAQAGLETLTASLPLTLCAYSHLPETEDASVLMATPEVRALTASDAYALFDALRLANTSPAMADTFGVLDHHCQRIEVRQGNDRGVFVVGTAKADRAALAHAARFCTVYGDAILTHDRPIDPTERPSLVIDVSGSSPHVEASVPLFGMVRSGFANGPDLRSSVAAAVVNASDEPAKLEQIAHFQSNDSHVVLVTIRGSSGQAMGAAPSNGDGITAVAAAAQRAIAALAKHAEHPPPSPSPNLS